MSETERSYWHTRPSDQLDQPAIGSDGEPDDEVGFPDLVDWLRREWVTLAALALIIVQVLWKAAFLSHFYFRQDDFHFTELALQRHLSWKYLSYVGSGHFHPGVLLVVWFRVLAAILMGRARPLPVVGSWAMRLLGALPA